MPRKTSFTQSDIDTLLMQARKVKSADDRIALLPEALDAVERLTGPRALDAKHREHLTAFLGDLALVEKRHKKTAARLHKRIERLLDDSIAARLHVDEGWADEVCRWLPAADAQRPPWEALLRDAATVRPEPPTLEWRVELDDTGIDAMNDLEAACDARDRMQLARVPAASWRTTMQAHVAAVGAADVRLRLRQWLHLVPASKPGNLVRQNLNRDLMRGLLWLCVDVADGELVQAVQRAATWFYNNNSPLGEACVAVLYQMPGSAGAQALATLSGRVRAENQRRYLQIALSDLAERLGVSPEDLTDDSIPTFGFTELGRWTQDFGDAKVEMHIRGDRTVDVAWSKSDGRPLKSAPARVKREHASKLKELKAKAAGVREALAGLAQRLESSYLSQRSLSLADWRRQLIEHPLAGCLGRSLIWEFSDRNRRILGCWSTGRLTDAKGREFAPSDEATVTLWHPLGAAVDDALAWRERLEALEITQPFKQAHRELYLLTDAERNTATYSNRFAAHILRQAQFRRLAKIRGWKTDLIGPWDGGDQHAAQRVLSRWRLRAEFWVCGAGEEYQHGFPYVSSDQVRFYPTPGRPRLEPLSLTEVPPLVFSEVMRDIDLFVGVASIGNDPQWRDSGEGVRFGHYWQDYSFGELSAAAQTRRSVLERLIPRLKIADRCKLDERFLVVRGDLRTYKIHFGSGNVLMLPNDQYLCIVPGRDPHTGSIMLPFEGDTTLSVILSKAFLLADDRSITDKTITRQITTS